MFSLSLVLSTFGIIFVAELPDKTALAALILATKYRARDVMLGAWLAFLIQTVVAVVAGSFFALLPALLVHIVSGVGFLVFAFFAFRRDVGKDSRDEIAIVDQFQPAKPIWLVSFLAILAAEWGDLTQLATAALVARNGNPLSIGIGALLALWAVTVVAVVAGAQVGKYLNPRLVSILSGVLFAGIGIYILYSALF